MKPKWLYSGAVLLRQKYVLVGQGGGDSAKKYVWGSTEFPFRPPHDLKWNNL